MINDLKIRNYAALMDELNLTGLEVTEGTSTVKLERHLPPAPVAAAQAGGPASKPVESAAAEPDYEVITSFMVGVFYSSPADSDLPFVSVGDKIAPGDVLCIIESMKLMNEITSDKEGTIVEICVNNGDVVDFGTPLFKIKR